ncbi:alpha/beta hydrolase [Naasia lichenicola]|uniref:Alpha/beta hydrolase n=1 Tax=Naasia lichenicola TaxID=2565933 RepID=A0A4S4FH27_9MICO|nr:alpha/beta hydrolase [Naasia lichenicola]THG29600.1 alpha/beta hydrolase [Naasia lichenicola]
MSTLAHLSLDAGFLRWIARIDEISPGLDGIFSPDPAVQREAARRLSDLLAVEFTLPVPDGIAIEDFTIDGPGGQLRMRRYRPMAASGQLPTQLWLHGGGFYAGTMEELLNDRLCAHRAAETGVQQFSLEYRLAPEHPYPAPVLDAEAAIDALIGDHERFGVDPTRLGIGGNSAGAAIAASTALRLRDRGDVPLIHLDLEVPPTSLPPVGASARDYAVGFGLDQIELIMGMYAGPDGPADPYISPLDVPDLTGLPPTLVMVAEHDPLRDSGIQFAERLEAAGVPVVLIEGAGHLHGTPGQTAASVRALDWQLEHAHEVALAYGQANAH